MKNLMIVVAILISSLFMFVSCDSPTGDMKIEEKDPSIPITIVTDWMENYTVFPHQDEGHIVEIIFKDGFVPYENGLNICHFKIKYSTNPQANGWSYFIEDGDKYRAVMLLENYRNETPVEVIVADFFG